MKRTLLTAIAFASGAACAGECAWCADLSLSGAANGAAPTKMKFSWSQGEADTNRVDILLAFDSMAQGWLAANGWTEEDFSREVIFEMNSGLALTGLDGCFTFRLAGHYAINADLSGIDISRLYSYSSGKVRKEDYEPHFAPLRQFRDKVAADIVVVAFVPQDTSYYGVSRGLVSDDLTKEGIAAYAEHAYCVVDIRAAFDRFCVLHEVGHIFGAGHADTQRNSPGPQLFSYSSGYRFSVGEMEYVTVMGYLKLDENGKPTNAYLPAFSSPDFLFNGVPIGTTKKNNNTRTLRETFPLVANFRVASPLDGGTEEVSGYDGIELSVSRLSDAGEMEAVLSGLELKLVRSVNVAFRVEATASDSSKPTVKVKGLPSGMKYTAKTGLITGYPKKAGNHAVTVTASRKGLETVTRRFSISVMDVPASLPGSYIGLVEVDSEPVILSLTVAANGNATLKGRINGKNRTFKATGMSSVRELEAGRLAFMVRPAAKICGSEKAFDLTISDRAVESSGFSGVLRQQPWGRKDVVAPKITKTFTVSTGGYLCKIRGNGRAVVGGRPDGVRVSGSFQLVPEDPATIGDGSVFLLPVSFPAKGAFKGLTTAFRFRLSVDRQNKVSDIEWN